MVDIDGTVGAVIVWLGETALHRLLYRAAAYGSAGDRGHRDHGPSHADPNPGQRAADAAVVVTSR